MMTIYPKYNKDNNIDKREYYKCRLATITYGRLNFMLGGGGGRIVEVSKLSYNKNLLGLKITNSKYNFFSRKYNSYFQTLIDTLVLKYMTILI